MKSLIQIVKDCKVEVMDKVVSSIDFGILSYVGICKTDTEEDANLLKNKILELRIFADADGKSNLSLKEVSGKLIIVSQFTLYGSVKRGRRPSYDDCMKNEDARVLFEYYLRLFENEQIDYESGVFGCDMKVSSINLGPYNLIVETKNGKYV